MRRVCAVQCEKKVTSVADFEWQRQTRAYFVDGLNRCIISITDVDFHYDNEFLGTAERLVITPLTERSVHVTTMQCLIYTGIQVILVICNFHESRNLK